jgi:hypothetical protein
MQQQKRLAPQIRAECAESALLHKAVAIIYSQGESFSHQASGGSGLGLEVGLLSPLQPDSDTPRL